MQSGGRDAEMTLVCRCEELTVEDVARSIVAGARTLNDVKRRTRAGMGACQGIYCMPVIAAMIAQASGEPIGQVLPMTARPPVRPVPLEAFAALDRFEFGDNQCEVGDEGDE